MIQDHRDQAESLAQRRDIANHADNASRLRTFTRTRDMKADIGDKRAAQEQQHGMRN